MFREAHSRKIRAPQERRAARSASGPARGPGESKLLDLAGADRRGFQRSILGLGFALAPLRDRRQTWYAGMTMRPSYQSSLSGRQRADSDLEASSDHEERCGTLV